MLHIVSFVSGNCSLELLQETLQHIIPLGICECDIMLGAVFLGNHE